MVATQQRWVQRECEAAAGSDAGCVAAVGGGTGCATAAGGDAGCAVAAAGGDAGCDAAAGGDATATCGDAVATGGDGDRRRACGREGVVTVRWQQNHPSPCTCEMSYE